MIPLRSLTGFFVLYAWKSKLSLLATIFVLGGVEARRQGGIIADHFGRSGIEVGGLLLAAPLVSWNCGRPCSA